MNNIDVAPMSGKISLVSELAVICYKIVRLPVTDITCYLTAASWCSEITKAVDGCPKLASVESVLVDSELNLDVFG
jgi:hypothetical protein